MTSYVSMTSYILNFADVSKTQTFIYQMKVDFKANWLVPVPLKSDVYGKCYARFGRNLWDLSPNMGMP